MVRPLSESVLRSLATERLTASLDLRWTDCCASTNGVLLDDNALQRDTVLVARTQTAGRGRRGRSWIASAGESLTFSLAATLPAHAPPTGLSLAAGAALTDALDEAGITDVMLKWPNDLLRHGGKLGGILIELSARRHAPARVVIGVGINLIAPPADRLACGALPAAGLDDCARVLSQPESLLVGLIDHLHRAVQRFIQTGLAPFIAPWQARCAYLGETVQIIDETGQRVGQLLGIDADGALRISQGSTSLRVLAGDVSLRPDEGPTAPCC